MAKLFAINGSIRTLVFRIYMEIKTFKPTKKLNNQVRNNKLSKDLQRHLKSPVSTQKKVVPIAAN